MAVSGSLIRSSTHLDWPGGQVCGVRNQAWLLRDAQPAWAWEAGRSGGGHDASWSSLTV